MKYIMLLLLISCSVSVDMKQKAEDYCKCNEGVAFIKDRGFGEFFVMCNDNSRAYLDSSTVVYKRECK